jgi:hypothetical protein
MIVSRLQNEQASAFQVTREVVEGFLFEGRSLPFPLIAGRASFRWVDRKVYGFTMYLNHDDALQTPENFRSRLAKSRLVLTGDWIVKEGAVWKVYRPADFAVTFQIEKGEDR